MNFLSVNWELVDCVEVFPTVVYWGSVGEDGGFEFFHDGLDYLTIYTTRAFVWVEGDFIVVYVRSWDSDFEIICVELDGLADGTMVGSGGKVERVGSAGGGG